jgi:CDP-glucose 4,6-dehydratase
MVNPSPDFWRGKRVLLTGHTGFKGAWLAIWLARMGAEVHGFARAPDTEPNLFHLAGLGSRIHHGEGDLRDAAAVCAAVRSSRPQVVLHLAAQALVRRSYAEPLETLAANVMGTANLLQALRDAEEVRAVVVVTTDKCYENREWVWPYRECDPLGGRDPYSASKACAEIVTAAFRDSYLAASNVAVASARAGNVVGGGDWAPDRLVPDCVRAFSAGTGVMLRNPAAVRPWQHVLEPLGGYLLLAERLFRQGPADRDAATAFNFGPLADDVRPVGWVVGEVARLWGPPASWEFDAGAHPHEAQMLALDAARARGTLGWRPRLSLAQCLDWTVHWYRAVAGGESALACTEFQIDCYLSLESAT